MKVTLRAAAAILAAALLALLVVLAAFGALREVRRTSETREHTDEAIALAWELMSSISDAETGERGFSLTGDPAFLKPYLAVRGHLAEDLTRLKNLTRIEAARKHLDALVPLVEGKLSDMAHAIELRRTQQGPPSQPALAAASGKRLMEEIRIEMRAFLLIEEQARAHGEALFKSNMQRLFTFIGLASLLGVLFTQAFALLVYRNASRLRDDSLHLETKQLLEIEEGSNVHLQEALAARQVSEEKLLVTLNSIGDAVIATDAKGLVTLLNPRAEALTGWSQADAIHRSVEEVFQVIHTETRAPGTVPVAAALAEGTIQSLMNETTLIARDGSECPIADSCAPIRDRHDQVIGAVLVFRDITAETMANQAVNESTALIKTIFNSVVDGIITLRASDTTIETINPAAERMFGYAPSELVGKNFSLLIPELDPEQNRGFLDYYSANENERATGMGHEVEGQRKDGSYLPLEIAISEMKLRGTRYFTGIFRDITTRKLAEEALLKGGALQNAIFNSANFSSIATDSHGVIQIFNVGAERMLGYMASEVVNKITPADISDPRELVARARTLSLEVDAPITPGFEALVFKASRGIEDIYELTYIRKDDSRFPAIVSVTALRDDQGIIIGYLLIGTDNTARKAVEAEQQRLGQRLRDSQFYARSLFESNVDALMTTDPSGFITDINKQMEALTGCTRDELIGSPFKSHFTDPERAEASIDMALREKKIANFELTTHARDGKETVVSFNATTFFDRDRNLQGVFGAARDVTEAKLLDFLLQEKNVELEGARSAAESANQAKSEFLSSMSHELRSPLNAILGFAQLIESDPQTPTSSQQESLGQILGAGWHLLKLIDQILDLAKVESGRLPLSQESVSMADVMLECESLVEHQVQQRGIEISFPVFEQPCFVLADHTRVKQVVVNLLSNAIKYNATHGKVEVECREHSPGRIRVSIRDTGTGLHPEQMSQLFQAFNRLGQEAGTEEGTGIGLVVAKRLVELMGGAIGVESVVGAGSMFWFELLAGEEPGSPSDSQDGGYRRSPVITRGPGLHTLLYIEDNSANLKLVEQIIQRHPDLRLFTAERGARGIELALECQPDLILLDINLPDINGFDVLKRLRENPATAQILVLALSANAMPLDIERARRAGFFRYLTKPIKIDEFMKALDEALEFAGHLSPDDSHPQALP